MKAILISAALLAPLAALANDETYNIEKKADAKPAVEKKTDDKLAVNTDLSQSQLLDKLHKVSVGHTEMGNLAQTHAKSDKLKRLGEKMAKDFTGLDQEVIGYAKDHDIVLSDATGMFKGKLGKLEAQAAKAGAKNDAFDLGKLQGEAFDKAFLTSTLDGCQRFVPVLEGAKGKFDDGKFDRLLGKSIDTLKAYQKDAEKLQKENAPAS